MFNTKPYTERIQVIALEHGVELNEDEALELLSRLASVTKAIYQPNETDMHDDTKQCPGSS